MARFRVKLHSNETFDVEANKIRHGDRAMALWSDQTGNVCLDVPALSR